MILNVVDLFAGAGGMGLGFLLAEHAKRRFNLVFSGEVNPVYTRTLKYSHTFFVRTAALIGRVCRKTPNLSTWLDKRHSTGSPPQSTTPAELMCWLAARHVRVFQAPIVTHGQAIIPTTGL